MCETGGEDPRLVNRAGVQAQCWRVQTGGRVAEVRFFNPQEGGAVLALLALAAVAALVAHQQQGDEEDAEDGERVKEDRNVLVNDIKPHYSKIIMELFQNYISVTNFFCHIYTT